MLTEKGTFIHGLQSGGTSFREFTLEEEVMRHSFLVSNDLSLDWDRLTGDPKKKLAPDDAYFSACTMAARLKVEGLDKVTPEMVEQLPKQDARMLLQLSSQIEQRRELFRAQSEAEKEGAADSAGAGLPGEGSAAEKQG